LSFLGKEVKNWFSRKASVRAGREIPGHRTLNSGFATACADHRLLADGDRPPWWKVEPPPPVNAVIVCPAHQRGAKKPNTHRSPEIERTAEMIQRTVRQRYGTIRRCYETTLARDPTVEGRVTVRFVIEQTGGVSSACIHDYQIPDGVLLECAI
jgi:hypothetical protein